MKIKTELDIAMQEDHDMWRALVNEGGGEKNEERIQL